MSPRNSPPVTSAQEGRATDQPHSPQHVAWKAAAVHDSRTSTTRRPLRVALATPLGKNGKGGMDRLADLVIDHVKANAPEKVVITRITTKGGDSKLKGSAFFTIALARLLVMLLFRRIDVLHINMAAYGSFYRKAMLAGLAEVFRIPYIAHIHSGRFEPFWTQAHGWQLSLINRYMKNSAAIIVLGQSYRELVGRMTPQCIDRVVVLANATPSHPPRQMKKPSQKRPLQITFLGVLADFKGVPQLLQALAQLSHRSDWSATLAGDGDFSGTQRRVGELGLTERVSLPGWIRSQDVAALLARTDIFVLPSFSEGQPMSILEAFSASTAVIATPLNAIRDVVDHERNGLLVPPGDVEALKLAIERLLDDEALRVKLATNAYSDHQNKYAIAAHVSHLVEVWENAHRGRRRTTP